MPYVIQAQHDASRAHQIEATRPEHVRYLEQHADLLLAAGALLADSGASSHGSLLIVDTEDRKVAEEFIANDPLSRAGLLTNTTITRWRKRFFDRRKVAG